MMEFGVGYGANANHCCNSYIIVLTYPTTHIYKCDMDKVTTCSDSDTGEEEATRTCDNGRHGNANGTNLPPDNVKRYWQL